MKKYNLGSVFDFGKYKNQYVSDVVLNDINYLIWCVLNIKDLVFSKEVIELVLENKNKIYADNNEFISIFNNEDINTLKDLEFTKIANIIKTNNLKHNFSNYYDSPI